jgi:hypothetical protein
VVQILIRVDIVCLAWFSGVLRIVTLRAVGGVGPLSNATFGVARIFMSKTCSTARGSAVTMRIGRVPALPARQPQPRWNAGVFEHIRQQRPDGRLSSTFRMVPGCMTPYAFRESHAARIRCIAREWPSVRQNDHDSARRLSPAGWHMTISGQRSCGTRLRGTAWLVAEVRQQCDECVNPVRFATAIRRQPDLPGDQRQQRPGLLLSSRPVSSLVRVRARIGTDL